MFHELFSLESISMIDGRGTAIVILIAIPDLNETRSVLTVPVTEVREMVIGFQQMMCCM